MNDGRDPSSPPLPAVLRVLDASGNRAREALRVLEDYTRFVLNHAGLSESLKIFRHDFATATRPWDAPGVTARDVAGDVGTDIKTSAELRRDNTAAVVTAAAKRLGEALRSIEEFGKIIDPLAAAAVEQLRYRAYALEQQVARTLRPPGRFADVQLYVLISESACRRPWLDVATDAIAGGADCLQLREKELDSGELLHRAKQLVSLCRAHDVLCIINDRPDIALLADADGVHVGQDDLPATEVRKLLGPGKIIGVSTHAIEQAEQAVLDGADYLGVGPVFRSPTKPRDITPGLPYAQQVAERIRLPAVAIAGITETNLDQVLATGLRAIAVTAAVTGCDDVRGAAERLNNRLTVAVIGGSSVGQTFLSATGGGTSPPVLRAAPAEMHSGLPPSLADRNVCPTHAESFNEGVLRTSQRRLPHWQLAGSTYFLTFRVAAGTLSPAERMIVLQHLRGGDEKFYELLGAVVMPDHAHALLRPVNGCDLPRIMQGIKGASARLVNGSRHTTGSLWQDESYDRIIRDQQELDEKLNYMIGNPVKRELVEDPWAYEPLYVSSGTS